MGYKFTRLFNRFSKKKKEEVELETEENILPELKPKALQQNISYQRKKLAEQLKQEYKIQLKKETIFLEDAMLVEDEN